MEKRELYTIAQVAKSCGTSRSTIMRMEENGLLEPAYINEETGYRYYNEDNILRVIHNLCYKDLGVSNKELARYYSKNESYENLLETLNRKLKELRDLIAVIRVQTGEEPHLHTEPFAFPELYCYKKVLKNVTDTTLVRPAMWETVKDLIHEGYVLKRDMYPYITVDATRFLEGDFANIGYDYTIYVPIVLEKVGNQLPPDIVHFSADRTISILLRGGNSDLDQAFLRLGELVRFRNYKVLGEARIVSLVMTVPGDVIPREHWVTRLCIPIETKMETGKDDKCE